MSFYDKRDGFKKPDLKAPRFRSQRLIVLSVSLFKRYRKAHPSSTIDYTTFRLIIISFNRKVKDTIINHRDGVELPKGLGFIFIGTCPKKKDANPDVILSREYDKKINHKNWDSNQYLCKIFYSNYGTKYKFSGQRHWYFKPCRAFKREVSKAYRVKWNMYRKISPIQKIARIYRDEGVKSIKVDKHDYNNRRVDFSDTQPD